MHARFASHNMAQLVLTSSQLKPISLDFILYYVYPGLFFPDLFFMFLVVFNYKRQ